MRDDLQELVDEASRVLAAPATLEDADVTLLAFCAHDDSGADPIDAVRTGWCRGAARRPDPRPPGTAILVAVGHIRSSTMAAVHEAALQDHRSGDDDILRALRTGTAGEHESVERALDLLDPRLDRPRLAHVLTLMHGFWVAAERGLDAWAGHLPADAGAVDWPRRRRAGLFAADLAVLGVAPSTEVPTLPAVAGTDDALGRLYVLEGSTLGGTFIDRHLALLPELTGVRIQAFSPYGPETGAMWAAYRRATRAHVAAGGDADRVLTAARQTFRALAEWCRPAGTTRAVPA